MGEFVSVAKASSFEENQNRAVDMDGVSVLLCRTNEGFFAVENLCTHQLQPLEGGRVRGCFIFCPLHGQRFNLKDGQPIGGLTSQPLKTFEVETEGDDVRVRL